MKLKSTYVDGLIGLIDKETGKIHTSFNQTVTATGRLSSTEPNLQNIPVRLEIGRRIRKVFKAEKPGNVLLAADYSQIELRILAHLSEDENLIKAFMNDEDIHSKTASEIFGVKPEEVTPLMRSRAKAVNFGIVYGISDFGLAEDLGISRKEAQEYIDNYFRKYPKVRDYIREIIKKARLQGYVTTILNRRRYLPDIYSKNFNIRSFAERTAINTPIQGSAADIIKAAMIRVYRRLKNNGLSAKMILQVHDELIFDVPDKEIEPAKAIIKKEMEEVFPLKVPLKVDFKSGLTWFDMEKA
jgi:DNA polymerase-1